MVEKIFCPLCSTALLFTGEYRDLGSQRYRCPNGHFDKFFRTDKDRTRRKITSQTRGGWLAKGWLEAQGVSYSKVPVGVKPGANLPTPMEEGSTDSEGALVPLSASLAESRKLL